MSDSAPASPVVVSVMVVDDQQPFRDAARAVIERLEGFQIVAEAESGEQAVEVAAALRPDLVLMDINMGAMDGITATSIIRSTSPSTMVVLLSTYDLSDLPATARTSGAVAYVNKDDFGGRALKRLWVAAGDPDFPR